MADPQQDGQPVAPALGTLVPSLGGQGAASTTPPPQQAIPPPAPPPPTRVAVYSPQGQLGYVAPEHLDAALASGGKRAFPVVSPQGQKGYVPEEHYQSAVASGGLPDLNSLNQNPSREGTYSMRGANGNTVDVPFSKIPLAQSMAFGFNDPSGQQQYTKDSAYAKSQQTPGIFSRVGNAMAENFVSNTQNVPSQPSTVGGAILNSVLPISPSTLQNVGSGAAKIIAEVPGYASALTHAAINSVRFNNSSELVSLLDPIPTLKDVKDQFVENWAKDPQMAVDNLLGTIAGAMVVQKAGGKVAEIASEVPGKVIGMADKLKPVAENVTGASDAVRKAGQEYVADTQNAATSNATKLQQHAEDTQRAHDVADDKNEQLRQQYDQDVLRANQDALEKHRDAVQAVRDANDTKRTEWQAATQRVQEENSAAQQALDLRRTTKEQFDQATQELASRVSTLDAQTMEKLNAQWQGLRDSITEPVDLTNLQKVIKAQESKMEPGTVAQFRQILSEGSAADAVDQFRQKILDQWGRDPAAPKKMGQDAAGNSTSAGPYNSYEELPGNLKSVVDRDVENQMLVQGVDPGQGSVPFGRLQGWITELGQKIYRGGELPSNIRNGLKEVLNAAKKTQEQAASDAGVLDDLVAARKATQEYKQAFGPPASTSAWRLTEAQRTMKEQNPELFAEQQSQQRIVAKAKFDPMIPDAYQRLNDIQDQLGGMMDEDRLRKGLKQPPPEPAYKAEPTPPPAKLPKPPKYVEPRIPQPPKLNPGPDPIDLQRVKDAAVQATVHRWNSIDKWQIKGLARSMGYMLLGALAKGEAGAIAGATLGVADIMAPKIIGTLIDRPAAMDWISKGPSAQDLATLKRIPDSDLIKIRDTVTGQAISMANAGDHFNVSPKTAKFLGPARTEQITQALIRGAIASNAASGVQVQTGTTAASLPQAAQNNQPPQSQSVVPAVRAGGPTQ